MSTAPTSGDTRVLRTDATDGPATGPRWDNPAVRYYDIDAANARVEELRPLLGQLKDDRDQIAELQRDLAAFRASNGSQDHAEELERRERDVQHVVHRMTQSVAQIEAWGVALRDIGTGLIDFPALANGRPIWLCWRLGEGNIEWWHEFDTGFAGRQPLAELT
jgi:hypothetical protein